MISFWWSTCTCGLQVPSKDTATGYLEVFTFESESANTNEFVCVLPVVSLLKVRLKFLHIDWGLL